MSFTSNAGKFRILFVLPCAFILAGCASSGRMTQPAMPGMSSGSPAGYLSSKALPSSLALLPAPPAPGSAAFALDEEVSKKSFASRGTPRWALATEDADLTFPHAAGTFSCALNAPITEQDTPHLYLLLRRTLDDAARATFPAKDQYQRTRPFVANKEPICTPKDEKALLKSGSYPSGHATIGWAWALILTEIAPDKTDAILARGRALGQSRIICNVHWQSDVLEGSFVGAATVARLHADATFLADLEAAKAELAAVLAKGLKPVRDCATEAQAVTP